MRADKAFLNFRGQTLLARALEVAASASARIAIVGSREKFQRFGNVVEDVFPDCGPLGGIHAALSWSDRELNLVLAVDLPFISAELLKYLVAEARKHATSVTVPRAAGGLQPLCAVYRRKFAAVAEAALRIG